MNRIYVNGRFLSQPLTGVQRFATEILSALDTRLSSWAHRSDAEWIVLLPKNVTNRPKFHNMDTRSIGHFQNVLWEQVDLPRFLHDGLLLNFGSTGPLFYSNQIVTVHDAQVVRQPSNFRLPFRLWYKFLLPRLGQRAKMFITVSEFSRRELAECFNIPEKKFAIIHNSAEHINRVHSDDTIFQRYDIPRGYYVLSVGAGRKNKNTGSIRRALELLGDPDLHLVEVGHSDPDVFKQVVSSGSTPVHAVGHVNDRELRALYEQALCFVFPSLYEGFGIPPIEAMLCGCPVIVSDRAAMPEVCGDAALYVDALAPREIADAVQKLRGDVSTRQRMVANGLQRANRYSWDKSASKLLNVIEDMLRG